MAMCCEPDELGFAHVGSHVDEGINNVAKKNTHNNLIPCKCTQTHTPSTKKLYVIRK